LLALTGALSAAAACSNSGTDDAARAVGGAGFGGNAGRHSAGAGASPVGAAAGGRSASGGAGSAGQSEAGAPQTEGAAGNDGSGGISGDAATGGSGGEASGGAAGSDAGGTADIAYVSTYLGGLFALRIDPQSGRPEALPGSPVNKGAHLYAVAVDRSHGFLYTADLDAQKIYGYRIGSEGSLPSQPTTTFALSSGPISLSVDPLGRFVYVTDQAAIHVLAIDPDSGTLTEPGQAKVTPVVYVAAEPQGKYVYGTAGFHGGVHGFRLDAEKGELEELSNSPYGKDLVSSGALAFRPDGAFVFSVGGGLSAFKIGAAGELDAVEGSPFTTDVASDYFATNLAAHPNGRFVYATSFLVTDHVSGLVGDPTTGKLEQVPGSPIQGSQAYSLGVAPSGRHLLVAQDDGKLAVYALDIHGSMHGVDGSPFDFGGLQAELAFTTVN
jgi:6-phosphogluconolactonase (cycloisomerase 2 family)